MQDEDVTIRTAFFFDHIHARDPKVNGTLAYTYDNIPWSLEDDPQVRQGRNMGLILPGVGFEDTQSGFREKMEGIAFKAALGRKGESDGLFCWHEWILVMNLNKNPDHSRGF